MLLFARNVAPDLQLAYVQAVIAWAPYTADIRGVKWCDPGECTGMGGGMFHYSSRVIAIDPNWQFNGQELLLTMEHEYGHALGLEHRSRNSIMKAGWDPPFANGPTQEDFDELENIRDAGTVVRNPLQDPRSECDRLR